MARINTNVSSLIAQTALAKNNSALNTSLQRLSTGLKINSGADDPAGLIASENLKSEQVGITTAIDNANRASNIIGTAEGGLSEVSNLLTQLQGLVSQSANSGGLSKEEINANQLQVDSILGTINRIAQSTSFQGKQLLNGNYDYGTSGVASTAFDNIQINSAHVPDGGSVSVAVTVLASATTAKLGYTGGTVTGSQGLTIEVAGNIGTQQLSFTSGTAVSSIAASINAVAAETGVSAVVSGTGLSINSMSLGSSQFVSIKAVTGSFATTGGSSGKAEGKDATVDINGSTAQADGTEVSYRSGSLDLQFNLHKSFNAPGNSTFTITGGGATFALGSKVTEANKASLGIAAVAAGNLGSVANGYLSSISSGGTNSLSSNNLSNTQRILDQAVKQVSELRGRLGAFQKFTIGSTVNSLGVAYENASSAQSAISDTDFAAETANLTREQILSQSASTVLSQANSAPQAALSLLRGA